MKRDMDIIRTILLEVEKNCDPCEILKIHVDGKADEIVAAHINLMGEAGLVKPVTDDARPRGMGLTWGGHEFLDTIRESSTWMKLKGKLGKSIDSISFEVLRLAAIALAKEQLRVHGINVD
jgi:hypothetical protein